MVPSDSPLHATYGPLEHEAYTAYAVKRHPEWAPFMSALTLGYTPAKAMGVVGGRSPASWAEMQAGHQGIARSLFGLPFDFFHQKPQNVYNEASP